MTNLYADLDTLKSQGALNITGDGPDARLLSLLESASRWIDRHCNRHFYVVQESRVFDGVGPSLPLPDLVHLDMLRTSGQAAGEFREYWRQGQYRLYPAHAQPTKPWGRPYHRVVAVGTGGKASFPRGTGTVEIRGRWGYREHLEPSGAVAGPGGVDAGVETLAVDDAAGIAPGRTLLLGREQLFVAAVDGNELSVQRGVNGTTAAAHDTRAEVKVFRYPPPVTEACLLLAAQSWLGRNGDARGETPSGQGFPGPEVRELLAGYRKLPVGV